MRALTTTDGRTLTYLERGGGAVLVCHRADARPAAAPPRIEARTLVLTAELDPWGLWAAPELESLIPDARTVEFLG